jgi:hypothetical protein
MTEAIVLAVIAICGFGCAMFRNWQIVCRISDEKRDSFRRGYYSGFLDGRLGRKSDWRFAAREEEDRESEGA